MILINFLILVFEFFFISAWTCALNTFTASVITEKEGITIMTSHPMTCTTLGSLASLKEFTELIDRWLHIAWDEIEKRIFVQCIDVQSSFHLQINRNPFDVP